MDKKIFLMAGLPRSGSTLLMNVLAQNPRFHPTPTSGLLGVLMAIRDHFNENPLFKIMSAKEREMILHNVMSYALQGYFANVDEPICLDKNRTWLNCLEVIAPLVGGRQKVKVLLTVRDVRDVCASFENLYRRTMPVSKIPQEKGENGLKAKTALGRLEIFTNDDQPIGFSFNVIRDAFTRGWAGNMLLIEYEALTTSPGSVMNEVYKFLEEDLFDHDFNNVEQVTQEDDSIHGFLDLHTIRNKVEPSTPRWPSTYDATVLSSDAWKKVEVISHFWRVYLDLRGRP